MPLTMIAAKRKMSARWGRPSQGTAASLTRSTVLGGDAPARAAQAEPAVAVGPERDRLAGRDLVVVEEVDEALVVVIEVEGHRGLAAREVVQREDRALRPVAAVREHRRLAGLQEGRPAPAELRALAPAADEALHPAQQRAGIPALHRRVDLLRPPALV